MAVVFLLHILVCGVSVSVFTCVYMVYACARVFEQALWRPWLDVGVSFF